MAMMNPLSMMGGMGGGLGMMGGGMGMMGGMGGQQGGMMGIMGMLMGLLMGLLMGGAMGQQGQQEQCCHHCRANGGFGQQGNFGGVIAFGQIGNGMQNFFG